MPFTCSVQPDNDNEMGGIHGRYGVGSVSAGVDRPCGNHAAGHELAHFQVLAAFMLRSGLRAVEAESQYQMMSEFMHTCGMVQLDEMLYRHRGP